MELDPNNREWNEFMEWILPSFGSSAVEKLILESLWDQSGIQVMSL